MSEWKYNKGEWAEGYVFLKVLGDGRINAGTPDLKPIEDTYIDIKNVQKRLGNDMFVFRRTQIGRVACLIECLRNDEKYLVVPSGEFASNADNLNRYINNIKGSAFPVPDVQDFIESLGINSIKSPPMSKDEIEKYGGKTDIFLRVRSSIDNMEEDIGFSIKSHFGSNATLLNCGAGTNYLFEIKNCTDADMIALNALDSVKEQLQYIKNSETLDIEPLGSAILSPKGSDVSGPIFDYNLEHVDSRFPEIIPYMLLSIYGYYEEPKSRSIPDVVETITKANPLNLRNAKSPYITMFKDFLFSAFSGLTATKLWDGKKRVTGGYLDVSKDGTLLYFRAISDDQFVSYLFNSTCIDHPSRGNRYQTIHKAALSGVNLENIESIKPDHGDYGYVFKYLEDGIEKKVLGINFQVRFRN